MTSRFSIDQIKTFINSKPRRLNSEVSMILARQLYDVMQENEMLKKDRKLLCEASASHQKTINHLLGSIK